MNKIIEYLELNDFSFKCEKEGPSYDITVELKDDKFTELLVFNSPTDDGEECNIGLNEDIIISTKDINEIIRTIRIVNSLITHKCCLWRKHKKQDAKTMSDNIKNKLINTIDKLFIELHEEYNTKQRDITPQQQNDLDKHLEIIANIIYYQVKQNM